MVKTLTALAAAGLITAATVSVPSKAEAYPVWVIPAVIAAGVGGLAIGAASYAHADSYNYNRPGTVYVQPRAAVASKCHIVRERTANGWRRVQVCG